MCEELEAAAIFARIDELRKQKGWTLYALAKKAGVSSNAVYQWRNKHSSPTLYMLEGMSTALKIPISYLLFGDKKIENLTNEETMILNRWKELNREQKNFILIALDMISKN